MNEKQKAKLEKQVRECLEEDWGIPVQDYKTIYSNFEDAETPEGGLDTSTTIIGPVTFQLQYKKKSSLWAEV